MTLKFYRLIIIVLVIFIFLGSIYPIEKASEGFEKQIQKSDKYLHFISYFSLAFFLSLYFKTKKQNYALISIIIATIYGASMESLQILVPYRNPSVLDSFFNFLGALTAQIPLKSKIFIKEPMI
jgi:VanZ family protein